MRRNSAGLRSMIGLALLCAASPLLAGPLDRSDTGPRVNPATNNMLRVPGVVGMAYQNALATLQQAGLNPRLHTIRRTTRKYGGREGTVVRQLPLAGGMAMLGSSVSITVYAPGGASGAAVAPGDSYGGQQDQTGGYGDAGGGQDGSGVYPQQPAGDVDNSTGQPGDDAGQGAVSDPYPTVPADGWQGPAGAPGNAPAAPAASATDQPVAPPPDNSSAPVTGAPADAAMPPPVSSPGADTPRPVDAPAVPASPPANPGNAPHLYPAPVSPVPPAGGGTAPAVPSVPRRGWRMPVAPDGAQRPSAGNGAHADPPVNPPSRRKLLNPRAGGL